MVGPVPGPGLFVVPGALSRAWGGYLQGVTLIMCMYLGRVQSSFAAALSASCVAWAGVFPASHIINRPVVLCSACISYICILFPSWGRARGGPGVVCSYLVKISVSYIWPPVGSCSRLISSSILQ